MSQLYLIDRNGSPAATANILDVQHSTQPSLSGRFVVKVPDNVPINGTPTLLGNISTPGTLIYQKAAGYLLVNASFTRITSDDLLDATHIDFTNSFGLRAGQRASMVLEPSGVLQSPPIALTGSSPTAALVTWDTYSFVDSDPTNALYSRAYNELPSIPTNVACSVSFNGGGTFITVNDSSSFAIISVNQGTSFIIKLTNVTTSRLSIGSWHVIY